MFCLFAAVINYEGCNVDGLNIPRCVIASNVDLVRERGIHAVHVLPKTAIEIPQVLNLGTALSHYVKIHLAERLHFALCL